MSGTHKSDLYKTVETILDRPIAYQRPFLKFGDPMVALMMSQAFYWTPRSSDADGWFYKTQAEWQDETGLTRPNQETARKKLRAVVSRSGKHIWHERLSGVPAKLYYRVDVEAVWECLLDGFEGENDESGQPATKDAGIQHTEGKPAIKHAETQQPSMRESSILDGAIPASKQDGFQHTNTENTTKTTTENTTEKKIDRSRSTTPPSAFSILEKQQQPKTEKAENSAEVVTLPELSPLSEEKPLRWAVALPDRWLAWEFDDRLNAKATQALAGKWNEEQLLIILEASDKSGDRTKYLMGCLNNEPPHVKETSRSYQLPRPPFLDDFEDEEAPYEEQFAGEQPELSLSEITPPPVVAPVSVMERELSPVDVMWQLAVAELRGPGPEDVRNHVPAQWENFSCLEGSTLELVDDGGELPCYRVSVRNLWAIGRMQHLSHSIKRTIGSMLKQRVTLEFCVAEGVAAS